MPLGACPVLCLTKIFLFAVTSLFVLYLPLGDPQTICDENNVVPEKKAVATMCNLYDGVTRVIEKSALAFDTFMCCTVNALYEGKLMVYSILSKYDREDYCRAGGCKADDEEEINVNKRRYPRFCKSKCSRSSTKF